MHDRYCVSAQVDLTDAYSKVLSVKEPAAHWLVS